MLQSNISRLRKLLRPDADIVARPPGYVLQVADDTLDAGRFERLCGEIIEFVREQIQALAGPTER